MKWRMSSRMAVVLAAGAATAASAQSITTVFVSNNGGASLWTNYFDVTVINPMTMTALDVNTSATAGTPFSVDLYTTAVGGTYVGNTGNPAVWTQIGTMSGTSAGQDLPSHLTGTPINMPLGTFGFAVRYNGVVPRYTNGTGANQNFSNADISLNLGASQATTTAPFTGGTPFTPRVWNGTIFYTLGQVTTGACCKNDGSCILASQAGCAALGGIYRGDNSPCSTANCPQPGACCLADGSCTVLTQSGCTAQSGVYRGDGSACATANCPAPAGVYIEQADAGELPGSAAVVNTQTGALNSIRGSLGTGDADMFQVQVCSPGNFGATTVGGTSVDTQLMLFRADGTGVTFNDDSQGGTQSTLTNLYVANLPSGNYYLAISQYPKRPNSAGGAIWLDGVFTAESQPDGPGAAGPITNWDAGTGVGGAYTIALTGTCFVGQACYANCDGSTIAPILNVNDFICFQTKFAAGDTTANCDGSTIPPILNVNDFICFQTKYSQGCP